MKEDIRDMISDFNKAIENNRKKVNSEDEGLYISPVDLVINDFAGGVVRRLELILAKNNNE